MTEPVVHEQAAQLVLDALDGPRGPQVASAIIHTWLCGGIEGVAPEVTQEIVKRWPYGGQVQQLIAQVERLSVLEHLGGLVEGMNTEDSARAVVSVLSRKMLIRDQIRDYLRETIRDPNARQALGLVP